MNPFPLRSNSMRKLSNNQSGEVLCNQIEIERGDVVTDGEDNSPDNPYGVRRTVLLDFMKATARNVDKINQKMYEHSKANNDQRKAFLREIMVRSLQFLLLSAIVELSAIRKVS